MWIVLLAVGLVFGGMLSGYTFLPLYLTQLGGQPSDVALSAGVSALAEIPSMLVLGRVVERVGLRTVFVAGTMINVACFASWTWLTVPDLIIATRLFTGVAFASILVATVLTIARLLPAELQATGQALFQTTAFGIAAIVSNSHRRPALRERRADRGLRLRGASSRCWPRSLAGSGSRPATCPVSLPPPPFRTFRTARPCDNLPRDPSVDQP